MDELRRLFQALKLSEVETFIASGNVIFKPNSRNIRALEKQIEAHLAKSLGYEVATFIRTESDLVAIAACQPFQPAQMKLATAFNVAFLADPLNAAATKLLMAMKSEIDDFQVRGREVYWLCRKRQSESKFSNAVFEKALRIRSTFRGMPTIQKLVSRLAQPSTVAKKTTR
jgi:uncharacterized protein (DUF1697 family)